MRLILTLNLILLMSTSLLAQKTFSEGSITYDVYMNGNKASSGTYVVTIKDNNILRTMKLFNGMVTNNIYNGEDGTTADLRQIQGTDYALIMSAEEVLMKNKRFESPSYAFKAKYKSFAGYSCSESNVTYRDGSSATLHYTKELVPQSENILSMFPGLEGIPLQYKISQGATQIEFIGRTVEFKNVDSDVFNIPAHYKIVSQEELNRFR